MLREVFPFQAQLYGYPARSNRRINNLSEGQKFVLSRPRTYKRLVELAEGELWVREQTDNNDGDRVLEYLKSVGLVAGQPWCAAYVSWVFKQAGYQVPRTGWSPALFPLRRLVKAAAPGNVFGIYFRTLKRIGHCGVVADVNGSLITCLEGNTNPFGARNGDGVYKRIRHKRSVHSFADWLGKGGGR